MNAPFLVILQCIEGNYNMFLVFYIEDLWESFCSLHMNVPQLSVNATYFLGTGQKGIISVPLFGPIHTGASVL